MVVQKTLLATLFLFLAWASVFAVGQSAPPSSPTQEAVWYWSHDCREKRALGLQVLIGGKEVYHSSFAICQMPRTLEGKQKKLAFSFKGGQLYQGKYLTLPMQTIEGNIWQAGADRDDLLLGVSFMSGHLVLLNTIHLAKPSPSCGKVAVEPTSG